MIDRKKITKMSALRPLCSDKPRYRAAIAAKKSKIISYCCLSLFNEFQAKTGGHYVKRLRFILLIYNLKSFNK